MSLTAHIAPAPYDHQFLEFLRTAEQLDRLRDARTAEVMSHVNACEDVIPVENQVL